MDQQELDRWFKSEVLPLEPALLRFLKRNWREEAEVADLRQETYIRAYEAAAKERPVFVKSFLFQIMRNLIIDRMRHKNVVPIETMADFGWLNVSDDKPTPEDSVSARQQLRLLQAGLDQLPPRCRQVVVLRKVEGLSQREVARLMGISEDTVEHYIVKGIRLLARSISGTRSPLISQAKRYRATGQTRSKP